MLKCWFKMKKTEKRSAESASRNRVYDVLKMQVQVPVVLPFWIS